MASREKKSSVFKVPEPPRRGGGATSESFGFLPGDNSADGIREVSTVENNDVADKPEVPREELEEKYLRALRDGLAWDYPWGGLSAEKLREIRRKHLSYSELSRGGDA